MESPSSFGGVHEIERVPLGSVVYVWSVTALGFEPGWTVRKNAWAPGPFAFIAIIEKV